jgi:ParB/RepB/Spo0J family partition protein
MRRPMSQVDKLQDAEEQVAQMREEAQKAEREAREADLRKAPLADTAAKAHRSITAPLAQIRTMVNMRTGPLPDLHELAVSIKEAGLLHPPLVRETGEENKPYELLAGRRRFGAMQLLDAAEGQREWRFTLVDGISRREALTMQFAENFHQSKPEPVQFARAARAIMGEDPKLTAAEVSRLVGAPLDWTRKALKLLDLPEGIVTRVEQGDLSFTAADIVRRGIARGDVSAEKAEDLVEQHAAGDLSGGALKLGVGYVPPKPKDYDELSRKLDQARWEAARNSDKPDADQRDWESGGDVVARDQRRPTAGAAAPPRAAAAGANARPRVQAEDLDAYVLGLVLARVATQEQRSSLGIAGHEAAQEYAFSLHPNERLSVLRALAEELLAADPVPPRALAAVLAA